MYIGLEIRGLSLKESTHEQGSKLGGALEFSSGPHISLKESSHEQGSKLGG